MHAFDLVYTRLRPPSRTGALLAVREAAEGEAVPVQAERVPAGRGRALRPCAAHGRAGDAVAAAPKAPESGLDQVEEIDVSPRVRKTPPERQTVPYSLLKASQSG